MHHLVINVQKCMLLLGSSDQKSTQKQSKMTVAASTKTFGNLKLENYISHINKACLARVPP